MKQISNRNHCLSWRSAFCCLPRMTLWLQKKSASSITNITAGACALISAIWRGAKSLSKLHAAIRPVVRVKLIT
ncbi:hypothetical protein [Microbulbifer aggregans]|uniref:hypothetical protein n=1 Tax=Microbulbifer aggregans TaxID=1769779 RepID=UPI001CFE3AC4|nr:hypothetical protein [Microbulbifer aggregans]